MSESKTAMTRDGCALRPVGGDGMARERVETFVRDRFWHCHRARPGALLGELLGIEDGSRRLIGGGGLSLAGPSRLFLELYLDGPVEEHASRATGRELSRTDLAEIGNLAVDRRGAGIWMMALLAARARGHGRAWGAFTATEPLRRLFAHIDAPLVVMEPADPGRLPAAEAERWGSYYDSDPRVCVAPTADFVAVAARRWPWLRELCAGVAPGTAARAA